MQVLLSICSKLKSVEAQLEEELKEKMWLEKELQQLHEQQNQVDGTTGCKFNIIMFLSLVT